MNTPRISVLLPCFNDGQLIDEALESVLAADLPGLRDRHR